jgi:hypothetical protein
MTKEEPKWVYTITRRPSRSDPGAIEEAWFIQRGNEIQLCTRDGIPLAGRINRRELTDGLSPAECAQRMLRNKIMDKGSDFNRRLSSRDYPKLVY